MSHVSWTDEDRMALYFVEVATPPRPISVLYDRGGSAAAGMTPADLAWEVVENAAVVHISGITPALGPGCRQVTAEAIQRQRAQAAGTLVSFDVNYREKLWSASEARDATDGLAHGVDLVICTEEDARDVFGLEGTPAEVAAGLADRLTASRVVVTAGSAGAAWIDRGEPGFAEAYEAVEVDRIGAGDAFAGGVLLGLLDDGLDRGVRWGMAMAALKLGIEGDHLLADRAEVEAVLAQDGRRISR